MGFVNWTPETVAEFNQIINAADKYEFCYPSAEVSHVPANVQRVEYFYLTIFETFTCLFVC